jgi:CheY-like chemotaxis protein
MRDQPHLSRILVVDDNRDWADAMARLLRNEGYSVHTAYDGREAIEAAASVQPEIVLLDLNMPNISGYDAAKVFRRHPSATRPVLIAITAWSEESHKVEAKQAGFDYYLTKPIEPAEVLRLLATLDGTPEEPPPESSP